MYGTGVLQGRREPVTSPMAATVVRRVTQIILAIITAMLLNACSGTLPFQSDSHEPQTTMAINTGTPVKSKQVRATTARDIMAEWGTFGIEHKTFKRGRTARIAPSYDEPPDLTLSIDDIMANAACHSCEQKPYHQMVLNASLQHGVPASLIHAVIQKESGYNPAATSKRHARGLMQITPETGRFVGVRDSRRLYDPQTNINAGASYLKYLMGIHETVDEVLAAYNSGPGNVRKYKGVPPFRETKHYVRDVKKFYVSTSTRLR